MMIPWRLLVLLAALAVLAPALAPGVAAHHLGTGQPDCPATVGIAPGASMVAGRMRLEGNALGTIGGVKLPYLVGVTPPRDEFKGDVVNAKVDLTFPMYLDGGHVRLDALGTPQPSSFDARGGMRVTAASFTGYVEVVPHTRICESILDGKVHIIHYSSVLLTGILTPTALNNPFETTGGLARDVHVQSWYAPGA